MSMKDPLPPAVVLAAFGVSYAEGLKDIFRVKEMIEEAFPYQVLKMAFTSSTIRRIWKKRLKDSVWRAQHPDVAAVMEDVHSPLAAIGLLQEDGHTRVAVQSLHIYAGEEYFNLKSMLEALASIKTIKPKQRPFDRLVLGRPALGAPGIHYDYRTDIEAGVLALADDALAARESGAILVYVGHGNPFFSSGVYVEFQDALQRAYPECCPQVGVVEGFPGLEQVKNELKRLGARKILLAPLLLVVGEHARKDIAGTRENSWKSLLTREGFDVDFLERGLGAHPEWGRMFVAHLQDALNEMLEDSQKGS